MLFANLLIANFLEVSSPWFSQLFSWSENSEICWLISLSIQTWKFVIWAIVYNSRSLTLVHTCLPVFDWIFTQKTGQFKECRGNFWSIDINLSHKEICVFPSPWMWIMNCDPCLWTWFFRHESCISWTIHRMWSTQHKDVLQICFARLARIEKRYMYTKYGNASHHSRGFKLN